MQEALRKKDEVAKWTLRMVLTAVKLAEVERGEPLDEAALFAILNKEVKQRQETIDEARRAERNDLIPKLEAESEFLQGYLPEALSAEALHELAQKIIAETGASGPRDMGKVMQALMPRIAGRADGKTASQVVRELLIGV